MYVSPLGPKHHGGEGGIRTLDDLSTIRAFQARALGHYATSPWWLSIAFIVKSEIPKSGILL